MIIVNEIKHGTMLHEQMHHQNTIFYCLLDCQLEYINVPSLTKAMSTIESLLLYEQQESVQYGINIDTNGAHLEGGIPP